MTFFSLGEGGLWLSWGVFVCCPFPLVNMSLDAPVQRKSPEVMHNVPTASANIMWLWNGCSFNAYNRKLLLTVEHYYLQLCLGVFTYDWRVSHCCWKFFNDTGKVRLISTSTDCKSESSTVSKTSSNCNQKCFSWYQIYRWRQNYLKYIPQTI